MGKIVEQSILDYTKNSFSGNIPHPTLITLMCIKGGVTFNETKEKCPRAFHLTLTRVLKTPACGEEVERVRKRKRATAKLPRETAPTAGEELEIGGFEDYPEQPVLSLSAEEIVPAQNRVERGKKRA